MKMPTLMLLGSGELGKEVVISAKRLGCRVIAVDSYAGAPAMQVADGFEVINMLDGDALEAVVRKHRPDHVVPEIEAIRTDRLLKLEEDGFDIIPSARAAHLTMNRDAIRDLAATTLGLPTAHFAYAESVEELREAILGMQSLPRARREAARLASLPRGGRPMTPVRTVSLWGTPIVPREQRSPPPERREPAAATTGRLGLPCVVKPVMSSSGKGQSVVRDPSEIEKAWEYACAGMRGDTRRVIVEELVDFDYEVTILTVRQRPVVAGVRLSERERTVFVQPIGHRQERGDYQESWRPCQMTLPAMGKAKKMAATIVREIAGEHGAGIFGVEFFVKRGRVIFSELSPRPHDTGMVTLIGQSLSEFDLHVRAILGLPIAEIRYERGAAASAVILAREESAGEPAYEGLAAALAVGASDVRIFGKPSARQHRRMGVALAVGDTVSVARRRARAAANAVRVRTGPES